MLDNWYEQALKRTFTVKHYGEEETKMYMLSKDSLVAMKSEEREIYDEFMHTALNNLMKTITVKMLTTEICNKVLADWNVSKTTNFPVYS